MGIRGEVDGPEGPLWKSIAQSRMASATKGPTHSVCRPSAREPSQWMRAPLERLALHLDLGVVEEDQRPAGMEDAGRLGLGEDLGDQGPVEVHNGLDAGVGLGAQPLAQRGLVGAGIQAEEAEEDLGDDRGGDEAMVQQL